MQAVYTPAGTPTVTAPASSNTGSYTVSWSAVGGATSYQVEESANGGGWTNIHNAAGGSVAVSGKGTGSYAYRARACNAAGCGADSATATTQVTLPPGGAPTVTAPATSTGSHTVSWTAVAAATSYQLAEQVNGGGWTAVYTGAATSIGLTGRAPATYGYRAIACNAGGCAGTYSAVVNTVVSAIPPAPTGFTGYSESDTSVRPPLITWFLSWNAAPGATYYEVQQQIGTQTPTIPYSGASPSWGTTGRGVRQFWVRACNPAGCSAWVGPIAP